MATDPTKINPYPQPPTTVSRVIKPQGPFLPAIINIGLAVLGRVVFPGTTRNGQGILTRQDRDPEYWQGREPIEGDTSYTRGPTTARVGGQFPVHVGNLR
jgi:hypothetical protein